ncbi:MAG: Eco57I restriction-modification methylase domain-containing protein [Candidatus Scalindua sp.]|nr:Eco57I restriction-modification methylase domain-containing protein [Candidatus Scalindua sp.]
MEQFTAEAPRKYKFFHEVLAEVNSEEHPNLRYYIYKTIILNNLYGVDIMREAVEIAKLRLFLKMVGSVDMNLRKPNFGLEPLPDIDFNIRAGNTLVGFATEEELKNAIQYDEDGNMRLDFGGKLEIFKEECQIVATAFRRFQDAQLITDKGEDTHKKAKAELQSRLDALNEKLNLYLASIYGIDKNSIPDEKKFKKKYEEWRTSHQPFHWFAEFYEIINERGGFDVIIGNPPYVEYSKVRNDYQINGYFLLKTGNLFSICAERFLRLKNIHQSAIGIIVPISSVSTPRMVPMLSIMQKKSTNLFISTYAVRPAKLFNGVDMNLTIFLGIKNDRGNSFTSTTNYLRWYEDNRSNLFSTLYYRSGKDKIENMMPKIGDKNGYNIFKKSISFNNNLAKLQTTKMDDTYETIYYHSGGRYFRKCIKERLSNEYKPLNIPINSADSIICLLSSSLYYYLWIAISDTFHVTKGYINFLTVPDTLLHDKHITSVCDKLLQSLKSHAERRIRNRADGTVQKK